MANKTPEPLASDSDEDVLPHYDFSKMKFAGRGLHAKKMRKGYTIAVHQKDGSVETKFVPPDPAADARVDAEYKRLKLIETVRSLREKARLTQAELARKVGVSPARIARMEDPNFNGQSVRELQTVVAALGMELELHVVKKPGKKS